MNEQRNMRTTAASDAAKAATLGKVHVGGKTIEPKKVDVVDPHRLLEEKNAKLINENKKIREQLAMKTEKTIHNGVEVELPGAILFGKDHLIMQVKRELVALSDLTGVTIADLSVKAGLKSDLNKMKEEDLEVVVARLNEFVSQQAGATRTSLRAQTKRNDKLNGAY